MPNTVGNSYFSERFFKVLLRDKDLVRTFKAQRTRGPILGWLTTILGAGLFTLLLALSGVSLYNNKLMLDTAQERGQKMLLITKSEPYKDPTKTDEKSIAAEITATDNLRELLVKLDDYERNGPPWYMRFGLYSGSRIYKQHLLPIYMSVIEHRFKTATIKRVEADLVKFGTSNVVANPSNLTDAEEETLGKNYDLLQAYLTLSGEYRNRADSDQITKALRDYWTTESKIPAELKGEAARQLDYWAKQVDRDEFPRID